MQNEIVIAETGEVISSSDIRDIKVSVKNILNSADFYRINGKFEPKKSGLMKLLSQLSVSYEWTIIDTDIKEDYAQVKGLFSLKTDAFLRNVNTIGICEKKELEKPTIHNMVTKAETRALKRGIDLCLGAVVQWYINNCLIKETKNV